MNCDLYQKWLLIFLTLAMGNPQIPQQQMFPIMRGPPQVIQMPGPPQLIQMPGPPQMIQMPGPPQVIQMPGRPPVVQMPAPPPVVQMPGPRPVIQIAPPPPSPLALPMLLRVDIAIDDKQEKQTITEKPTTAKTIKDNLAVAIPMPIPMPPPMPVASPVLFAVPGMMSSVCEKNQRHPNCPPCPPCTCSPCTPSFFSYCSLCHQKCRCRKPEDVPRIPPPKAPLPLPGPAYPMLYPGYLPYLENPVYVAFVPQMAPPSNSEDFSESDSCEDTHWNRKIRRRIRPRKRHKHYDIFRRSNRRFGVHRNDSGKHKARA